jgi:ABC-type sugar transport system ATPase subunit
MIQVQQLSVRAGTFSLENMSFEIASAEYAVLMGRTGTGKTTLLETICGLRAPTDGQVRVNDGDVTMLPPAARGIGYVPQDRALFMTMTVRENLGFSLRVRGVHPDAMEQRVVKLADTLGLTRMLDRRPHGLSGGEAQRVALGRAIASEPGVLCLDEPLSGLDDETRSEMHQLLRAIHQQTRATILHVTHHIADAQQLATKLLRLEQGAIHEEPIQI